MSSFYLGERVDTSVVSISGGSEVLNKQRPLFGIDSIVAFPRSHSNDRFSLNFAEGYHQLSWFDTSSLGKLRVTFVYSKSGDGVIHSVSCEPVMRVMHDDFSRHSIHIEYVWIEEQPVDYQAGSVFMLLTTLCVLLTCGLTNHSVKNDESPRRIKSSVIVHDE